MVDALDSKSSSSECGFESHSRYFPPHLMSEPRTIGIIAGKGVYPRAFMEAARAQDPMIRLVVVALHDETDALTAEMADEVIWLRVGQLSKLCKFFVEQNAKEAVMMGQISPSNLFQLRPDFRILIMLAKVKERNAETLFGAISDEMAKDGITVLPATTFLDELLPSAGHVCGPKFKRRQLADAEFGFRLGKQTSAMDIGQSIVVRHGTVLAQEAFEGTNACIRRGGELGHRKDVMLVKVSKPNQDMRFDVPVIGPKTIEVCAEAGVSSIAIEADKTLLLENKMVEALCQKHGIGVHAVT